MSRSVAASPASLPHSGVSGITDAYILHFLALCLLLLPLDHLLSLLLLPLRLLQTIIQDSDGLHDDNIAVLTV